MAKINRIQTILMAGCACAALSACGANDIASPGTGGNVIINPTPTPTPNPNPTPTPTPASVTPASGCPTIADPKGLTDDGTIKGPTGEWRVCTLPSIISKSVELPKIAGLVYQMDGRVDVGCDSGFAAPTTNAPVASSTIGCTKENGFSLPAQVVIGGQTRDALTADTNVTLTIQPGVIMVAGTGTSWLAVNRGNKINAVGTADKPIIFTSRDNVFGLNTDSSNAQWGGVVLMGRARITDCNSGSVAADTCERQTEGASGAAVYGGRDDKYNAGTMKYVQIRYSGYVLGANSELQALTTEGTGSDTTLEYIQSHNSSDDGAEFFGGTVRMKYYIATGADDDSLDADVGVQGRFQHVLLIQRPGQGDALMEIDSNGLENDTPRQNTIVANFTAIQSLASSNNDTNDQAAILNRGNSDLTLVNGILVSPNNECVRLHGTGTAATRATLTAHSVLMQCNGTRFIGSGSGATAYTADQVAALFNDSNNNVSYTSSLTSVFINGANETTGITAFDAKTLDSYFDTTTHVGAVKDANDTWYAGWTCNSSYAPFDDTSNPNRACTSLPIT
ncbi:MAG: hypothetical protein AB7E60_13595 [Sphingobium sp.]